jgi:clan AA aspartic protease
MGLTHIKLNIANPAKPKRAVELSFLVDSGAVYSVIPSALLRKLGVRPHSKRIFALADGSEVTRKLGDVLFRLNGRQGAAPVIFGEKQDSTLLGAVSLEALGMMLDPTKRELRPLPMLLGSLTPSPSSIPTSASPPEATRITGYESWVTDVTDHGTRENTTHGAGAFADPNPSACITASCNAGRTSAIL